MAVASCPFSVHFWEGSIFSVTLLLVVEDCGQMPLKPSSGEIIPVPLAFTHGHCGLTPYLSGLPSSTLSLINGSLSCTWRCKRWHSISDAAWSTYPCTLVIQPSMWSCLPQQQVDGLVQLVHLVLRFFSNHSSLCLAVQILHCFKNVKWSSLTLFKWNSSIKITVVSSIGYFKSVHRTFVFMWLVIKVML